MRKLILVNAALLAMGVSAFGQASRRANMVGNGSGDQGKCTVEVVVDGVANVEIRGDTGYLRTVSGQPAQWRRFECNGVMPRNPADFRFSGVDGRGKQQLVADPRNGGVAVVHIEDPSGGSEAYTFDIEWRGVSGGPYTQNYPQQGYPGGYGTYDPRYDQRGQQAGAFDRAVAGCEDAERQRAYNQYQARDVTFLQRRTNDQPGNGRDRVAGAVEIQRNDGRRDRLRYDCSVNLNNGRVRSVNLTPMGSQGRDRDRDDDRNYDNRGYSDRYDDRSYGYSGNNRISDAQVNACRNAVSDRIRRNGYQGVEFGNIRQDNQNVVGTASANGGTYFDNYEFTCSIDPRNGNLTTVDVRQR
jgi:hypothetical protein